MKRWNILLTGPIHQVGREMLEQEARVWVASRTDEESLIRESAKADAIISRYQGRLTATILRAATRLKVIGRHGIGVDNIDMAAATELGIRVVNTPEANQQSVAEHTWAFIFALRRGLVRADSAVRDGNWEFRNSQGVTELSGETLGVVGMGRIGRKVASFGSALGMKIVYTDFIAAPEAEAALGAVKLDLKGLLAVADVVTLHLPQTSSSRKLIGRDELASMKPTALLINTARGGLIDESALIECLSAGHLGGAGLDVFEQEPASSAHPLLSFDNVIVSPHCAANSMAALKAMSLVSRDVLAVLNGQEPQHPVN